MHYFIGLVIISVCAKCFNIDVRIYGIVLILAFFCHFDIDVCIYSIFFLLLLVVKRILMLIMYSAASL